MYTYTLIYNLSFLQLDAKVPDDEKLRMYSELDELKQANRVCYKKQLFLN